MTFDNLLRKNCRRPWRLCEEDADVPAAAGERWPALMTGRHARRAAAETAQLKDNGGSRTIRRNLSLRFDGQCSYSVCAAAYAATTVRTQPIVLARLLAGCATLPRRSLYRRAAYAR